MNRLKMCLLLHFYQPWWQFPWVIEQIVEECYRPILEIVEGIDGFCFTININLCLLLHLEEKYPDIIESLNRSVKAGKLELVGSTAQHPIMPLIPEFVQKAQIEEDLNQKRDRFGLRHNSRGFFFPEMAFSTGCIDLLKSYDYQWAVTDDEPFAATYGGASVPLSSIISWNGFNVFMRSGRWSNLISSGNISFSELKSKMECEISGLTGNAPIYLIIAMDAETFGHHDRKRGADLMTGLLKPMLQEWSGDKIVSIGSLGSPEFSERAVNYLPDGSWSTSSDDVVRDNPFPLWSGKTNINRYRLWKLVNLALTYFEQAREECLRMTSSCHWWQISRSGWEPDFMKEGARLAMNVINKYGSEAEIASVQNDFEELMRLVKVYVHSDSY